MLATRNDITGDSLVSRTSEAYRNNYDAIFGKKGKTNEQRKGLHDGAMEQSSGISGAKHQGESRATMAEETDSANDRLPTSSEH